MNKAPQVLSVFQRGTVQKLLLVPNSPLLIKEKELMPLDTAVLTPQDVVDTLQGLATIANYQIIMGSSKASQGSFTTSSHGVGRLKINFIIQRGTPVVLIEKPPLEVPDIRNLIKDPDLFRRLSELLEEHAGIILFTGSSLDAMSDVVYSVLRYINNTESKLIYTVEKPLRYLVKNSKSAVIQREVGVDVGTIEEGIVQSQLLSVDLLYVSDIPDKPSLDKLIQVANRGTLCLAVYPSLSPLMAFSALSHLHASQDLFGQIWENLVLGVLCIDGHEEGMTIRLLSTPEEKVGIIHGD
jgi:Tfp pilus assembly ATPase PilU